MWHTIFVAAHAVTATTALITGVLTVVRSRLFGTYLGSLVAMEMFLVLAVSVQWSAYSWPARAAFAALAALGGVVVWQGLLAWQIRPPDGASPSVRYFEHAGFTLVALVDAFLVVTVLDTGAPGWAVAATGVLVALAGHFALRIGRRWMVTDVYQSTTPADAAA
jgi:hypothetical protein